MVKEQFKARKGREEAANPDTASVLNSSINSVPEEDEDSLPRDWLTLPLLGYLCKLVLNLSIKLKMKLLE